MIFYISLLSLFHTCTFYLGKTYKCEEKILLADPLFGDLFRKTIWDGTLVPIWLPFGILLAPFWSLWAPVRHLWAPPGTLLDPFYFLLAHFRHPLCSKIMFFEPLAADKHHFGNLLVIFLKLCMHFDDFPPKTVLFRFTSRPLFLNVASLCFCCVFVDTLLCRNSAAYRWHLFTAKTPLPPWPGAEPSLREP